MASLREAVYLLLDLVQRRPTHRELGQNITKIFQEVEVQAQAHRSTLVADSSEGGTSWRFEIPQTALFAQAADLSTPELKILSSAFEIHAGTLQEAGVDRNRMIATALHNEKIIRDEIEE